MECNLNEELKVIILNIEMKYQVFPIIYHCPNWYDQIRNEKKIVIDKPLDLNGVKDFFDGLQVNFVKITPVNCKTILELAQLAGSQKILQDATNVYNENNRTVHEIAEELITNSKNDDKNLQCDELFLSKHYNELLMYPQLLKNIEISSHYRILKLVIQNDKNNFNIHKFLDFLINCMQNDNDNKKYSVLLSLLNPIEFNEDEISRLSKCKNYDDSFAKYKISDFLTILEQNKKQIQKQDEIIQRLQNNQDQIISQFDELKKSNNEIIIQMQAIMSSQTTNLMQKIEANNQSIKDAKDELNREIHDCNEQIKKQSKDFTEIMNSQAKSIDEIKQQSTNLIEKINTNNQSIKNAKDELNREIHDCNEQIKKQSKDFTEIMNSQVKSIDEIKQQSTNLIEKININNENLNLINNEFVEEMENRSKNILQTIQALQGSINENNQAQEIKMIKERIEYYYYLHYKLILSKDFENDKFSGIISALTKSKNCNINDSGLIKITREGSGGGHGSLSSIVDYNFSGQGYLISDSYGNPMICFDFKDFCISISAYSIKTSNIGNNYMRSWVIEGSNNDSEWSILDSHCNDTTMGSPFTGYTFFINEKNKIFQPFRFIRLRLTGKSTLDDYRIDVTNIEFFGKLFHG